MFRIFNGGWRGVDGVQESTIYIQLEVKMREHIIDFEGSNNFVVFQLLLFHSDSAGRSYPSEALLMRESGLGNETLYKCLKALKRIQINGRRILLRYQPVENGRKQRAVNIVFPSDAELGEFGPMELPGSGVEILDTEAPGASTPCDNKENQVLKENQLLEEAPGSTTPSQVKDPDGETTQGRLLLGGRQSVLDQAGVDVSGQNNPSQGEVSGSVTAKDGPSPQVPPSAATEIDPVIARRDAALAVREASGRGSKSGSGFGGRSGGLGARQSDYSAPRSERTERSAPAKVKVNWLDSVPAALQGVARSMSRGVWAKLEEDGELRSAAWLTLPAEQVEAAIGQAERLEATPWEHARNLVKALNHAMNARANAPKPAPVGALVGSNNYFLKREEWRHPTTNALVRWRMFDTEQWVEASSDG